MEFQGSTTASRRDIPVPPDPRVVYVLEQHDWTTYMVTLPPEDKKK
jgi:hypothetical protein